MNYHDHIVRDPAICGGAPTFKGTRVLLRTVLSGLKAGETTEEILADYPALTIADVKAAIAFAAASAEEDLPTPELPRFR
jgi:uncharacterized protein (DUF433 family)